MVTALKK
jgi:EF-hand domain pair